MLGRGPRDHRRLTPQLGVRFPDRRLRAMAGEDTNLFSARQMNRLRVIQALYRHPGSSRTAIAEITGLSRPTVSAFMEELERAGHRRGVRGRRAAPERRPPAGADVARPARGVRGRRRHGPRAPAGRGLRPLRRDPQRRVHGDRRRPRAARDAWTWPASSSRARSTRADVAREQVIGVGMALAAPVDGESGRVFAQGILPSWGGVEPVAEMAARLEPAGAAWRTTRTSARSASTSSARARASTSWSTCGSRRASGSGSSSAAARSAAAAGSRASSATCASPATARSAAAATAAAWRWSPAPARSRGCSART